jgi:hypothetical protein
MNPPLFVNHPQPLTRLQYAAWRRVIDGLKDIPCLLIQSSMGAYGRLYISVAVGQDAVHVPDFNTNESLQEGTGVYLFWIGPRGAVESNRWGFLLDDALGLKAEEYFCACLDDIAQTATELYHRLKEIAQ